MLPKEMGEWRAIIKRAARPSFLAMAAGVPLWFIYYVWLLPFAAPIFAEDCDVICIEKLLDFSQYKTVDEFRDRFDNYFVPGVDTTLLQEALEARSEQTRMQPEAWFPDAPIIVRLSIAWSLELTAPFTKFDIRIQDSIENASVWSIGLMHSRGKLIKAQILRHYDDKNFAARGIPFEFSDFRTGELLALRQMLKGRETRDEIDKLMARLNAKYLFERSGMGYRLYQCRISVENYLDPPTLRFGSGGGECYITWMFKKDGTLRGVSYREPSFSFE